MEILNKALRFLSFVISTCSCIYINPAINEHPKELQHCIYSFPFSPLGWPFTIKIVSALFIMADLKFDSGRFWSLEDLKAFKHRRIWCIFFFGSCSVFKPQKTTFSPRSELLKCCKQTANITKWWTSHTKYLCQMHDRLTLPERHMNQMYILQIKF